MSLRDEAWAMAKDVVQPLFPPQAMTAKSAHVASTLARTVEPVCLMVLKQGRTIGNLGRQLDAACAALADYESLREQVELLETRQAGYESLPPKLPWQIGHANGRHHPAEDEGWGDSR